MSKSALGRGLGALLSESPSTARRSAPTGPSAVEAAALETGQTVETVQRLPLGRIRACPLQPRKSFSEETLRELADSIREQGIVQPLIVRARGDHFELIAGERRWRAAEMAGVAEVPVIVRDADDRAVLELALIENLQRENLNPLEEAQGYAQLVGQFKLTQEIVAEKVGKSRAAVANALRLLKLAPLIQDFLRDGRLSVGHAKVILGLSDPAQQETIAEHVIKEGLNVRQTEKILARMQAAVVSSKGKLPSDILPMDAHVAALEGRLRERFGTKVRVRYNKGKGSVDIQFFSDDDLERILQITGVSVE